MFISGACNVCKIIFIDNKKPSKKIKQELLETDDNVNKTTNGEEKNCAHFYKTNAEATPEDIINKYDGFLMSLLDCPKDNIVCDLMSYGDGKLFDNQLSDLDLDLFAKEDSFLCN